MAGVKIPSRLSTTTSGGYNPADQGGQQGESRACLGLSTTVQVEWTTEEEAKPDVPHTPVKTSAPMLRAGLVDLARPGSTNSHVSISNCVWFTNRSMGGLNEKRMRIYGSGRTRTSRASNFKWKQSSNLGRRQKSSKLDRNVKIPQGSGL
ncbi:uncharacterized protein PgNI_11935 [Pyricularia grisea]|uniref:Uncharacterized protein n=1 Tax=Pyricularia grisea TaxID=148305 RepID=A0A6P8AQH5_PYRGI|nr:uncharacterized protein PgNI_11935 [Pyricularia grisea]TLD04298.1 hypothetical protein PgNI_11935 [Pyricularia grisea]